jgi:23S rRNA pseudouridine2605 synthase
MTERLQKVMAHRGICSRRKAEELILAGKVAVDGHIVRELGLKVIPEANIEVYGEYEQKKQPLRKPKDIYILLHKPTGYICSTTSEQGKSVLELITKETYISSGEKADNAWAQVEPARIYPVGRLDKDSEGLVLLTNDGAFANKMTHPRYGQDKEYEVSITGRIPKGAEQVLEQGMDIGDGERARGIRIIKIKNLGKRTIITLLLKEGKNRQIRRMFGRLGMNIVSLKRVRIDRFLLKTLPVGSWVLVSK